jgi:multidrug efflux pump subunit AcrA (membrane-fusion protein)
VTRRVPIEAELPNDPAAPVRPGAFVRARVFGRREVDVLRLPGTALRPGAQDVVLVAEGGVLRERRVAFSIAHDGALLVRRGLTPDARVLAAPTAETRDGEPIRVDGARAAGATP